MQRRMLSVLVSAWFAHPALAPTPATAAVTTYAYEITGGTSSGIFGQLVGTVTGGAFSVEYNPNYLPCFNTGCHVALLNATITGTAGQLIFSPSYAAGFGPAFSAQSNQHYRTAKWVGPNHTYDQYSTLFRFRQGNFFGPPPDVSQFGSGGINVHSAGGLVHGAIIFTIHEVAVPEPTTGAMLVATGLMLGAYALRRARRSLG